MLSSAGAGARMNLCRGPAPADSEQSDPTALACWHQCPRRAGPLGSSRSISCPSRRAGRSSPLPAPPAPWSMRCAARQAGCAPPRQLGQPAESVNIRGDTGVLPLHLLVSGLDRGVLCRKPCCRLSRCSATGRESRRTIKIVHRRPTTRLSGPNTRAWIEEHGSRSVDSTRTGKWVQRVPLSRTARMSRTGAAQHIY